MLNKLKMIVGVALILLSNNVLANKEISEHKSKVIDK